MPLPLFPLLVSLELTVQYNIRHSQHLLSHKLLPLTSTQALVNEMTSQLTNNLTLALLRRILTTHISDLMLFCHLPQLLRLQ
jgi:hypothetical protein